MKRRRNSQRILYTNITSFCFIPVKDHIFKKTAGLLVNNRSDIAQALSLNQDNGIDKDCPEDGKREAIGMPGGGRKVEETPAIAAINELKRETGFDGKNIQGLFIQPEIIIKYQGRNKRKIPFEIGQDPSYTLPPKHTAIRNIVCTFSGGVDWEGSNLQQLLHTVCKTRLQEGLSLEEIQSEGLYAWFDGISKNELESLNIEELNEISMIGIFPISLILRIIREGFPEWAHAFYMSHILRIAKACQIMGIMETEFEEVFEKFESEGGTFVYTPYDQATNHLSKITDLHIH